METTRSKVQSMDNMLQTMVSDLEGLESRSFSGGTKQMEIHLSSRKRQHDQPEFESKAMKKLGESASQISKTSGSINATMSCVEVPVFTGDDLRPWIDWMEQYFARYDDFTDLQKQAMAYGFIEGEALSWYHQRQKVMVFQSWDECKQNLLLKFGRIDDPERIKVSTENDKELQKFLAILQNDRLWKEQRESPKIQVVASNCAQEQIATDTSIQEAEAISAQESVGGNASISELESEAKESNMEIDGVSQLKVSISPLEPSFKFSNESLDVMDAFSYVFFEQSQVVDALEMVEISEMSTSVKTTQCALQLFDKMLMGDGRRKQQWDETSIAQEVSKNGYIQRHKQIVGTNKKHPILCRIAIQAHPFTLSKLEGKLVFNGGSNGEAATCLGNEMFMFLQSFPVCFWTRSGLEIHGDMKLMFLSARESRESFRDSFVTPILQVGLEEIELQRLQDSYVVDLTHLGIARFQVWYRCKNKAGKLQPFSELMMWGFVHSRSGEGIGFLGLVNASLVAANGAFIIDAAATSLSSQSIRVQQSRIVYWVSNICT
ncbi:hypothetical protein ISN45_Aa03g029590 [Arabidopsis thaliana x Arabidopsis arenosa]|uniref:Retrotransposon gag domain-containing protein n=1 Tax=Arabidopsis thaliana x Arabidopsis arenosa TaxID=1240361 RepID=A0A8T2B1C7_9BRAS|nr:hypothetical protein ISN45_Aa03g029590 [Arabidopsis thaliana x Arabidopsis arenosa]